MRMCHSNYSAGSFEEANYDLGDFLDEYFVEANITFLPTGKDSVQLGLATNDNKTFLAKDAFQKGGGGREYPSKTGIWKIIDLGNGTTEVHLLISEPQKLAQTQAFNSYNDLLGEPFADYDDQAYVMIMQPEDIRRVYNGKYFTINVSAYGLKDDATDLPRTVADITFTDYTAWVMENRECGTK